MMAAAQARTASRIDLADPDRRARQVAAVDRALGGHDVLGVEQQDPQLLALERAHRVDERLRDVGRRADQPRIGGPGRASAPPDLDARPPARGAAAGRDAGEAQLRGVSAATAASDAEPIDEAPAEPPRPVAAAEHQRQQLLVGAGVGAEALERGSARRSRRAIDGESGSAASSSAPTIATRRSPAAYRPAYRRSDRERTTSKRTRSASATEMPLTVACIAIGASRLPVRW